ncbi:V-set and immunoglobulin domain-containing protein 10-like [Oncorhynchus masou masou]|uniref:V-set and immunoglobulin domain-containing protein 10-like n=1 Tax=Oncorhynchus masou masou TaxID=90313 RepID=UPI0031833343
MSSDQFGVHKWHILKLILLIFMIGDVNCDLTISTLGPSLVNTTVGSNVTLAVTISGVPDPVVTWKMGSLPVVTWTLGSSVAPDIAIIHRDVLKIETDGSLTFRNVSFVYSNTYTVEIVKSGFKTVSATFVLKVYDYIRNVSVNTEPADALEGAEKFTLQYSTLQGEADQWRWYFNSVEIQNNSHYTVGQKSLVIHQPNRNDTGPYTLVLTNPFSTVTFHRKITVLYGPDEPMLGASPSQAFFVSGDTLSLSCQAEGVPQPSTSWMFGGQTLPVSQGGSLNLTNVQISQGGIYTCVLVNVNTGAQRKKNLTVNVYESPTASPLCSVNAVNGNVDLQFHCRWPGGTPEALLSFPALTNATSGAGDFNLTIPASQDLNGKMVLCRANHPLRQTWCNITATGPAKFLPMVLTTVDREGKIVVTIHCNSQATPKAMVTWSKGTELLANGLQYQISVDTAQLNIHDFNTSTAQLYTYTCNCSNPLGNNGKKTQLLGPTISDSSLFPNQNGTIVTMTWEVPPTSVITGFDIQMSGPDLLTVTKNGSRRKRAIEGFRSIQQRPGSSRSTDISVLDPKSTYYFRVIPIAGRTQGEPSAVQRIGPGGLSRPQIIGLAVGIPCGLLFLLLLIGLIYLCVYCCRKKRQQNRYPVPRAVEKVVSTQPDVNTPNHLLTGGLKPLPDYNRITLQAAPAEQSIPLPTFVAPPPVRTATIV